MPSVKQGHFPDEAVFFSHPSVKWGVFPDGKIDF